MKTHTLEKPRGQREDEPKLRGSRTVSRRAIALGLVLIPINARWIAQAEIADNMFPTYIVPFYTSLTAIFLLALGNLALRKTRWRLSAAEMLTVFVMLNAGAAVMSCNFAQVLIYLLPYTAFNGADPWRDVFLSNTPKCLLVSDPTAVANFYRGGSSIYSWQNLHAWLLPSALWTVFVLVLVGTLMCLAAILRKQWIERERLSFPTVPVYLELVSESGSMFRSRIMWCGFALAGGLTLWNGLAYLYPSIPIVNYRPHAVDSLFQVHPWTALLQSRFGICFVGVAISFFMPLDLSMSCWIFYILSAALKVFYTAHGVTDLLRYSNAMAFGSYLGIFGLGLWVGRQHLLKLFQLALKPDNGERDPNDPLTPRQAVGGFALGVVLLGLFMNRIGLSLWLVPAFLLVYIAISVMITRIRSEFSFPVHDLHGMGSQHVLSMILGTSMIGPRNLSAFALLYWFQRVFTSHPMPHQMEAMKMGESVGASNRGLLRAFMLATAVGTVAAIWASLDVLYTHGAATAKVNSVPLYIPSETFGNLGNALTNPAPFDGTQSVAVAVGASLAIWLGVMRHHFAFFPFHPLGLAMNLTWSWAMTFLWMSILVGSVIKMLTLKYGGLKLYQRFIPFFVGAMLGEFVVGGLWTLVGMLFGVHTCPLFE